MSAVPIQIDGGRELRSFVEATQSNLQPFLTSSIHSRFQTFRQINPKLCDEVRDALTDFCTGGKAIRAALVELGYLIAGGAEGDARLHPMQLSVELTHAALLIHDDIVDHSDLRRNHPTLHRRFSHGHSERKLKGEATDYGRSVAMLVGDMALCLAHYFALDSHFDTKHKIPALNSFINNLVVTGLGQIMDIQLAAYPEMATSDSILGMTNYKTAYYTVVAPMQLGALLAGRSDNLLSNISSFGSPLGIAFQLQDDVLGLFGTQEDIGKPQSSDLQEGKQTLLIKYGLEKTKNKEKAFVKSCLRNKKLSEADLHRLRTILADCGAKDEVRKVALEHQDVAIKAIPSLTMDKRYQAILHGLCHYMVDRDH